MYAVSHCLKVEPCETIKGNVIPPEHNAPQPPPPDELHADDTRDQDKEKLQSHLYPHVLGNIAGLHNETGQNNCFINALVQCLRSCTAFMEKVQPEGSAQPSNRVVQELLRLLADMKKAELNWQAGHVR